MSEPEKATITSKNLPQPPAPSPKIQRRDEPIVAKPLVSPDFTNLKLKNPNIALYWGNRVAGGGQRYEQLKASGFVNATVNDVEAPEFMVKDGAIIFGDLILLKIAKRDYLGALKYNEEKAVSRMRRDSNLTKGQAELRHALGEVPVPPELSKKISMFVPGEKETEDLLGKD